MHEQKLKLILIFQFTVEFLLIKLCQRNYFLLVN